MTTDWKCPRCGWVNREFAVDCLSCGEQRPANRPATKSWDLVPSARTPELTMSEPRPTVPDPPVNKWRNDGLNRGIAFAAAAAVLSALIWYAVVVVTEYELGIVAALIGWIVGTAAVVGARRRGSYWLVAMSVVFTLLALVVAEYLIAYHFLTQIYGPLDLIQPPWVIIEIVIELLAADPVSLLFWGFALYAAASVPFKAITPEPAPAPEPLPAAPDGQMSPQGQ